MTSRTSTDNKSSLEALHAALDNLENMTEAILTAYHESLQGGDYERLEDLEYDFESVNDRLWAEKDPTGELRAAFEKTKLEKEQAEQDKGVKVKKEKSSKSGSKSGR